MKNFLSKPLVTTLIGVFIGGALVFGYYAVRPHAKVVTEAGIEPEKFFDSLFNDDFFGRSKDPFAEMQRMQKRMLEEFKNQNLEGSFDNWYKKRFGGGKVGDVSQREDADFIYYEIETDHRNIQQLNVDVKNGRVMINGQFEEKKESGNTNSIYSSSFTRSLPTPQNVDAEHFKIDRSEGKVTVKFPKRKS
ncbi:MAG: Hsp20/alpha crystallin family protein [Pseudobdellovibrio sp.]